VPRPDINVLPSFDYRNPVGLTKDPNKKVMKIVHLADLHIDYDYKAGTNAECDNEVLCCQEKSGYPDKAKNISGAGFSPTTRTFGSQEANPIPKDLQTDWVYEVAYESWQQWIPPDQKETFLSSGHYAVEINPKFRVLVVNTNVCYGFNMWQLYDPQDPGGQLEWLQKQLALTDSQNKTAHIVGHVPPGHEDCFKTWSREFYKIVAKYRNVIRGQFYGHTHYDEFRVLHDPLIKSEAINVMWVGPSLTPYRIHNPGYRIYHVDISHDSTYGDVIDHETWIYDLEQANTEAEKIFGIPPRRRPSTSNKNIVPASGPDHFSVPWFRLYQATEIYGIKNLLPKNLKLFVIKMAKDRKTFDAFYKYYFKATDPNHQSRDPCDTICRKRILCGMVQAYYDDDDGQVECNAIQKDVDGVILPMRVLEHRKRFIWL
ncbi:Sphingomyelin phosphodiesterase, partial [Folsomia candida]